MNELQCITRTLKTLADDTVRLTIEFEPRFGKEVMSLFGSNGTPCILKKDVIKVAQQNDVILVDHKSQNPLGGAYCKELRLSSFLRTPDVWKAIGSDQDYQKWIREQPCLICKHPETEYAHYRKISLGAGIGIKPEYSGLPLCHKHHMMSHQSLSSIGGEESIAKARIDYLIDWCWDSLRKMFRVNSLKDADYDEFINFCKEKNIDKYLPKY